MTKTLTFNFVRVNSALCSFRLFMCELISRILRLCNARHSKKVKCPYSYGEHQLKFTAIHNTTNRHLCQLPRHQRTFLFHSPCIKGIHLELNTLKRFRMLSRTSEKFLRSKVNAVCNIRTLHTRVKVTVQLAVYLSTHVCVLNTHSSAP